MLSRNLRKKFHFKFSSFNIVAAFDRLKSAVTAPKRHIKAMYAPNPVDNTPFTNTTNYAFDEVAQEWQALIVGNSFDRMSFNSVENVAMHNFGTVDNPNLIFTADAPYRYVGCTGATNEDEYEGHELLFLMLREGPLQRCPQCGQVFKLVRLRQEFNIENEYYSQHFTPHSYVELGDADSGILIDPFRMDTHYEYTQFEVPSNRVYSLVPMDEHDRILTDPAYRIEKLHEGEIKARHMADALKFIDQEVTESFGNIPKIPISKVEYQTMVDVEEAMLAIDRHMAKVHKFHSRKFIDLENHERREKRMNERSASREAGYTFFFGNLTEEEQKYRDYFETDLEQNHEDEFLQRKLDNQDVLNKPVYNINNFDFVETMAVNPEEDHTTIAEKLAFKFQFRRAKDSVAIYQRRQARMMERHINRFVESGMKQKLEEMAQLRSLPYMLEGNSGAKKADFDLKLADAIQYLIEKNGDQNLPFDLDLNEVSRNALKAKIHLLDLKHTENRLAEITVEWVKWVSSEAVQQYKDYYESEPEDFLSNLSTNQQSHFIKTMDDSFIVQKTDSKGFATFPARNWESSLGFWPNLFLEFSHLSRVVAPKSEAFNNNRIVNDLSFQEADYESNQAKLQAIFGEDTGLLVKELQKAIENLMNNEKAKLAYLQHLQKKFPGEYDTATADSVVHFALNQIKELSLNVIGNEEKEKPAQIEPPKNEAQSLKIEAKPKEAEAKVEIKEKEKEKEKDNVQNENKIPKKKK